MTRFGHDPDDLLGRSPRDFAHPEDHEALELAFPECEVKRETVYLKTAHKKRVAELAKTDEQIATLRERTACEPGDILFFQAGPADIANAALYLASDAAGFVNGHTLVVDGGALVAGAARATPAWSTIHQELKRKGVTLQLLWEEYTQQYPNRCYSYSQFCDRYRHWRGKQKRSMHQAHKAGEKCFVDYAGQTVPIVDAESRIGAAAGIQLGANTVDLVRDGTQERLDLGAVVSLARDVETVGAHLVRYEVIRHGPERTGRVAGGRGLSE